MENATFFKDPAYSSIKIDGRNGAENLHPSAKFKQFQQVIVSGMFTGLGDMPGTIYEINYCKIEQTYYYLTGCQGNRFYCNEKFLSL